MTSSTLEMMVNQTERLTVNEQWELLTHLMQRLRSPRLFTSSKASVSGLEPFESNSIPSPYPKFGSAKGLIEMTADFDEPLEEFQEYMP